MADEAIIKILVQGQTGGLSGGAGSTPVGGGGTGPGPAPAGAALPMPVLQFASPPPIPAGRPLAPMGGLHWNTPYVPPVWTPPPVPPPPPAPPPLVGNLNRPVPPSTGRSGGGALNVPAGAIPPPGSPWDTGPGRSAGGALNVPPGVPIPTVTPIPTFLDQLLGLRGSLGGAFGALAGAALDVVAAFRKISASTISADVIKRGAYNAALGGAPAAARTAYKEYRTGGADAAIASIAGAAAAIAAIKLFSDALAGAISAVGRFAVGLASPNADPSGFVSTIGGAVSGVSNTLFALNPILGTFGMAVGASITVLGDFMRAMDGMVERYSRYSPELAVASAQAQVTQLLGDIRRSREAAPELLRYIQQRVQLQQKIEDFKIRFMSTVMPLIITGMKTVEDMLPLLQACLDQLAIIAKGSGPIPIILRELRDLFKKQEAAKSDDNFDLLKNIMQGMQPPGSNRGVRTPEGV